MVPDQVQEHEGGGDAEEEDGPHDGGIHLCREQALPKGEGGDDERHLAAARHGEGGDKAAVQEGL